MFFLPGSRRRLLADPRKLGRWGERRCEKFLRKKGFEPVARNYSCKHGEIDLVMSDPFASAPAIVFVEVKTRSSETFQKAQESVTPRKRKRMILAAKYFISTYDIKDKPLRFDVVAVILGEKGPPEIRHYKKAFTP